MIGQIFKNKKGQEFIVENKSSNKSSSGNYKWFIRFLNSNNCYEVNKSSIIEGSFYDFLYEEQEFMSKIYPQHCGDSVKVIKKIKNHFYECEFINYPYKCIKTKYHILNGNVFNPWIPNGELNRYIGEGKYNSKTHNLLLKKWNHLIARCSPSSASYNNSNICDEWKCFQNFAAWYEENSKWNIYNYNLELDKDILFNIKHLEKKIYSPETCLLIPSEINTFIIDSPKTGVFLKNYKFVTNINGIHLGTFDTFKEAKNVYAQEKYKRWKLLINQFKFPKELKDILLKYDFSWYWILNNITEDEILQKYYDIENKQEYLLKNYLESNFNITVSHINYLKIKNIFDSK